jgi:hypothetical protein
MKYRFLLIPALVSTIAGFGQHRLPSSQITQIKSHSEFRIGNNPNEAEANQNSSQYLGEGLGAIIMYESFDAGLPIGWTNTAINNALWVYRGPSTSPSNAVGSQGAYSSATPLASTSTSDGFFIFDSDYLDNNGVQGNFGNGPAAIPHKGEITSSSIDCSNNTSVLLTFETYLRNFDSHHYVIVSNDDFVSADTVWNGSDFYATNDQSVNGLFVKLDVTETFASQPNCKFKFVYESIDDGYYVWMFDDVILREAAEFDNVMEETFFKGVVGGSERFHFNTFYGRIPLKQVAATPLDLGSAILNRGSVASVNTQINVNVTGAESFTSSSIPVTYNNYGEVDSVEVSTSYTPSTIGSYSVEFSVTQESADDYISDNVMMSSFNVTERTYSWNSDNTCENAVIWGGQATNGVFSRMDVFDPSDSISAVEFAIYSSATNPDFMSSDQSNVLVGVWPVIGGSFATTGDIDFNNPIAYKYVTLNSSDFNAIGGNKTIKAVFDEPVGFPAGVTEVMVGFTVQNGDVIPAMTASKSNFLNTLIDVDSDGAIDFYTTEYQPIINLITWTQELCNNTTVVVDAGVDCDKINYTATIDAFAVGGQGVYNWDWSSGATTEDITVSEEGTYVATATDENFCVGTATFEITNASFNCNLSVNELAGETFNFTVQPNPSKGIFNLAFEALASERVNVQIQSIKGDVVYNNAINISNGTMTSLDLTSLSNGVYIMKVSGSANTVTERIIIQ